MVETYLALTKDDQMSSAERVLVLASFVPGFIRRPSEGRRGPQHEFGGIALAARNRRTGRQEGLNSHTVSVRLSLCPKFRHWVIGSRQRHLAEIRR